MINRGILRPGSVGGVIPPPNSPSKEYEAGKGEKKDKSGSKLYSQYVIDICT